MDIDAFVAAHRDEWQRLAQLVHRRGSLNAGEVDELVVLYQRAATHLSAVRSTSPDPALVSRLSTLVAQARSAVTATPGSPVKELARFFRVTFPAAVYRSLPWWAGTAVAFLLVGAILATWVAGNREVQAAIASPVEIRQLVTVEFEHYYSANPAGSFAFRVWTNNVWVAAVCLFASVPTLGLLGLWMLFQNVANVAVAAGLMAANGRLALFFGLILPHGLLELTAVFVAAGAGLRLAWTVIDPGRRTRGRALVEEGLAAGAIALGLIVVLLVSGGIEAFVTPSGLPTAARIGIGCVAEAAFLSYVLVLGRRAVAAGATGGLTDADNSAPYAA